MIDDSDAGDDDVLVVVAATAGAVTVQQRPSLHFGGVMNSVKRLARCWL